MRYIISENLKDRGSLNLKRLQTMLFNANFIFWKCLQIFW